jgi:lipopolysaccharide export system permease protein
VAITGGILSRSIFSELLKVFLLSLTSLSGLFLLGLVIQNASQMGLTIGQTLAMVPLLLPFTLPYTIPATTLFATCVVYGRIAKDNEAVALKAAGVDLFTLLKPALMLGVLAAGIVFALAHTIIPDTQMEFQSRIYKNPEDLVYNLLKRERTFRASNFPYSIHVKDVQGKRLIDLVLKRWKTAKDANGKDVSTGTYDVVVRAREARLRVQLPDPDRPGEPAMLLIDPDRWVLGDGGLQLVSNGNRPVPVPLPDIFTPARLAERTANMTWDVLPIRIAEFQLKADKAQADFDAARAATPIVTDPVLKKHYDDLLLGYKYTQMHWARLARSTLCEYYTRPALAISALVFALIGVPVGLYFHRADYLSSFITCFLPAISLYYPILLAGTSMARDGKMNVPLGVFAADAIVGFVALVLTWRLIKR